MTLAIRLHETARAQNAHGDLPDALLKRILAIADHPDNNPAREEIMTRLLDQLLAFDPYAHAGCFNEGYDAADIERTLAQLDH